MTDNACLFTFTSDRLDSLPDFSNIEGGCGIYALDYIPTERASLCEFKPDSLRNIYPLKGSEQVLRLEVSGDSSTVLCATRESGSLWLTLLDSSDYSTLSRLEVMPLADDIYLSSMYVEEGFVVFYDSMQRFAVVEYSSGEHSSSEHVPAHLSLLGDASNIYWLRDNIMHAFDGGKLYVVSYAYDNEHLNSTCGFALSIYTERGLVYSGIFDSSLDLAVTSRDSDMCRLTQKPFVISLAEDDAE